MVSDAAEMTLATLTCITMSPLLQTLPPPPPHMHSIPSNDSSSPSWKNCFCNFFLSIFVEIFKILGQPEFPETWVPDSWGFIVL